MNEPNPVAGAALVVAFTLFSLVVFALWARERRRRALLRRFLGHGLTPASLHVLANLARQGDALVTPRRVDHFAYFGSFPDAQSFAASARTHGYDVHEPEGGEAPQGRFAVQLHATSAVDPATVAAFETEVRTLVRDCGGEYDGWGCPVRRDAAPAHDANADA